MFLQAKNGFIVGKSYPDESPNLTNIEVGDEWKNIPLFHDDFPFIFLYKCIDGEVLPRGQEEIDADIAARPAPPPTPYEELSAENDRLKAQITMQSEQLVFLEDCILEMGDVIYA